MQISEDGKAFIKRRESVALAPHWDAIGKVWDIGYGHVLKGKEREVYEAQGFTQADADALFDVDSLYYGDHVNELVTAALSQEMFDALASFVFNVGHDNFAGSTLLRYVNAEMHSDACVELLTWNKARGQFVPGLLNRRAMEVLIYARGEYP